MPENNKIIVLQVLQFFVGALVGALIDAFVGFLIFKNPEANVFVIAMVQLMLNIYLLNIVSSQSMFNFGLFTTQTLLIKDYFKFR
jgi:hypothetical protein